MALPPNSGVRSPAPAPNAMPTGNQGTTLPLNPSSPIPIPQLAGSSPAPAIQAVSPAGGGMSAPGTLTTGPASGATTPGMTGGLVSPSTIAAVPDPGGSSLPLGQLSVVSYPPDQATQFGVVGANAPGPVQGGPTWSQANISGNPNPGALAGSPSMGAPTVLPGATSINQVNPTGNPNPGAL